MSTPKGGVSKALWKLFALGCAAALELNFGPFFVPSSAPQANEPSQLGTNISAGPAVEGAPLSAFGEVLARPLFSESRRPPPVSSSAVTPDTSSDDNPVLQLLGIILTPDKRMALIQSKDATDVVRVFEGESVSGWQVHLIKATQVVLKRGSEDEVLKLDDANKKENTTNSVPLINVGSDVPGE